MSRLGLGIVCFHALFLVVTSFATPSLPITNQARTSCFRSVSTCGALLTGLPLWSEGSLSRNFFSSSTALRLGGDGTVQKPEQDEDEDEDEDENDDDLPLDVRMDALRRMQSFKAMRTGQKELQSGRLQYTEVPLEITVTEADQKLRKNKREEDEKKKIFLLDVRERDEYEFCHLRDSVLIPMSDMKARYDEVPKDREVLVYCHHGQRSMQVVRYLRTRGWRTVTNIQGGIEEWRVQVDPSIPEY